MACRHMYMQTSKCLVVDVNSMCMPTTRPREQQSRDDKVATHEVDPREW